MKAGRPSYHVKPMWITVPTVNGLIYYQLDDKGKLIGNQLALTPHRAVTRSNSLGSGSSQPDTQSTITNQDSSTDTMGIDRTELELDPFWCEFEASQLTDWGDGLGI